MSEKFKIKHGSHWLHFEHKGIEFEAHVVFDADEQCPGSYVPILEIWTISYEEDGSLFGYDKLVGEVYLDDIFEPTQYWKEINTMIPSSSGSQPHKEMYENLLEHPDIPKIEDAFKVSNDKSNKVRKR